VVPAKLAPKPAQNFPKISLKIGPKFGLKISPKIGLKISLKIGLKIGSKIGLKSIKTRPKNHP
jgi:hypothetical protein